MSDSDSPTVAGIDRWRGGWVIALGPAPGDIELIAVEAATEAIEITRDCAVVAVDMPMALVARGTRAAEVELRSRLGAAGRSVFISPTRAALEANDQAEATRINRSLDGPGISAQAWGLAGSIRELRAALPRSGRASVWFETHPESAFAEMHAGVPLSSKKTALGVGQRLALLGSWCEPEDLLLAAPERVPVDDALDALAAWWSARRIEAGAARVVGPTGRDDEGFEQSIRI